MEFFKLHATMYVQRVLYTLKKKFGFLLQWKKNSRWTLSSLVVVHCIVQAGTSFCPIGAGYLGISSKGIAGEDPGASSFSFGDIQREGKNPIQPYVSYIMIECDVHHYSVCLMC